VSVAAALRMDGERVSAARIALGGVAHRPWRATLAEQHLTGRPLQAATLREAAAAALADARPLHGNAFKVPLAQRAIVRSVLLAAGQTGDFA
jgi:xanthine dehydrogenase YagS FAD-binding subunit